MIAGAVLALLYAALSGYTGVVMTNFFQFIVAMIGALLLGEPQWSVPLLGTAVVALTVLLSFMKRIFR